MSKISLKHSGGNVVSLNSPTNAPGAADVAFKLPNADGTSGQAIVTDASGNLSFASTGKILQVIQTYKTDTWSDDLGTGAESGDITGLTASITPSNSNNKILVMFDVGIGGEENFRYGLTLYKAGSVLTASTGDASGSSSRVTMYGSTMHANRNFGISGKYLDTAGGTSSITYSLRARHGNDATLKVYVNRPHTLYDAAYGMVSGSSIILMEVEA